jgi:hypothetical protein
MKNTLKYPLLAAAALAVASSAQAYTNGDLLVGFTGGSSDFIYDLGPHSSLTSGQTWTIGSSLGTQFGVVGSEQTGKHIFATSFDSVNENNYLPAGLWANARADITTIAQGITVGLSRTTTPTDTTGWTYQTAQPPGTPGNTFQNDFFNPNVSVSATAFLYDNLNAGSVIPDGLFTYNSANGVLTYAVPEPSTFSLFAGFGLLALSLRRRLA